MNDQPHEDRSALVDRLCWVLVVAWAAVVYCFTPHI